MIAAPAAILLFPHTLHTAPIRAKRQTGTRRRRARHGHNTRTHTQSATETHHTRTQRNVLDGGSQQYHRPQALLDLEHARTHVCSDRLLFSFRSFHRG